MTKTEIYSQSLGIISMLIPFQKGLLNNPDLSFEENQINQNKFYSLIALKDLYEKFILEDSKKKKTNWYYNRKDYCKCGKPKSIQSTNCASCSSIRQSKCNKEQVIADYLTGTLTLKQTGIVNGVSESEVNKIMCNYRKELRNETILPKR